ncbi:MAG: proline--tRNA ligase [bacterium]|nr:proline--tRNA ligase [bacterium]
MLASRSLIATLRDDPGDAVVASHRLMIRAGLVRKLGAGLYHLLPMGLRTFRKIENVIREEMNAAGALEFQLPILTPSELWEQSGRWEKMGKEMMRFKDRHEVWNALGPTHEESFSSLVSELIKSYRDLPLNVYQIHTKFRDEIRPRFGVIRSREFCMKDAYSFDLDEKALDITYQKMRVAYRRIFARLGLSTVPVEADTGAMGGTGSEEFMVPSEIGEETLLVSENDKYRSNQEKTPVSYAKAGDFSAANQAAQPTGDLKGLERHHTPGMKTIADVAKHLNVAATAILKTVLYYADGKPVAVCLRGDRDVNEIKLSNHLDGATVLPATPQQIKELGSVIGFIGPLGLSKDARIVWDLSLTEGGPEWIVGANEAEYHCGGCVLDPARESVDLALAQAGDPSPAGDGVLKEIKGIEVGHIFKLGKKYTEAFKVTVQGEDGRPLTPVMGCYGVGVNRTMATIIEQWHDDKGILWPISAAPYEIALVSIAKGEDEIAKAREFYEALTAAGCDVLWDDRPARPGVKFGDAELIGYPIRLTMGKGYFQDGELEVVRRADGEQLKCSGDTAALVGQVLKLREELYAELEHNAAGAST